MEIILLDANVFGYINLEDAMRFFTTEKVLREIEAWQRLEYTPKKLDYSSGRHNIPGETPLFREGFMTQKSNIAADQDSLEKRLSGGIYDYEEFSRDFDSVKLPRILESKGHENTLKGLLYCATEGGIRIDVGIPRYKLFRADVESVKNKLEIQDYFRERFLDDGAPYKDLLMTYGLEVVLTKGKIIVRPEGEKKYAREINLRELDFDEVFNNLEKEFNFEKKRQELNVRKEKYNIDAACFENALKMYRYFRENPDKVFDEETVSGFGLITNLLTKTLCYNIVSQPKNYSFVESKRVNELTRKAMELFLINSGKLGLYPIINSTDRIYLASGSADDVGFKGLGPYKKLARKLGFDAKDLKVKAGAVYRRMNIICNAVARDRKTKSTREVVSRFKNGTATDINLFSTAYNIPGKVVVYSDDRDLGELRDYTSKIVQQIGVGKHKVNVKNLPRKFRNQELYNMKFKK